MRVVGLFIGDKGEDVVVIDFLFAVGERLEADEDVGELVVGQIVAEFLELRPQGGAA